MSEQEKAFAHYDAIKAALTTAHNEAARTADAGVIAAVDAVHRASEAAWTDYVTERGWTADAQNSARSGGEDKPPREGEEAPGGEG